MVYNIRVKIDGLQALISSFSIQTQNVWWITANKNTILASEFSDLLLYK